MSKEVMEKLCSLEEWLLKYADCEISCAPCFGSPEEVEIAGEVIDMIKDIADAKKNCYKAEYYKTVVEAMKEYDEEEEWEGEEGRSGYNNRRYANGRYAPSGRGSRRGYHPYPPVYMNDVMMDELSGYPMGNGARTGNRGGNNGTMSSSNDMVGGRSGYGDGMDREYPVSDRGRHYDDYRMAKRHYTETRSEADKKRMKEHADEYVSNTVAAMLEIWNAAEPEQKQHIKSNMMPLINGMNA